MLFYPTETDMMAGMNISAPSQDDFDLPPVPTAPTADTTATETVPTEVSEEQLAPAAVVVTDVFVPPTPIDSDVADDDEEKS